MNTLPRHTGSAKFLSYLLAGLFVGLLAGYVFIGSADRIIRLQARQRLRLAPVQSHTVIETVVGKGRPKLPSRSGDSIQNRSREQSDTGSTKKGNAIHTLTTSNGTPYQNYQTRILYGTYKLVQAMPGGENLVGFTRILHRTKPDVLMNEVPTFRAEPLTPKCDGWCEFPVSDRPNAVAQFFAAADRDPSMIKAPWLLMLEGDYVWMKPLQAPRAESAAPSLAFPYSYIMPSYPTIEEVMRKMWPAEKGSLAQIPNTGPAPVLMRVHEWAKIIPEWERLTAHIEAHKESKDKLGWVREMYAFSVAAALQNLSLELAPPPESPLMAQPPADHSLGNGAFLHYTWGTVIQDAGGKKIWSFDKRDYTAPEIELKPPEIPLPPPRQAGYKLQDGGQYDADLAQLTSAMLTQMNRAIQGLPTLQPVD